MGSIIERSQSWHRRTTNNTDANLAQGHLVLDEITLKHGRVVDTNGIDPGETGWIDTDPGQVIQTKQYEGFVAANIKDPVYQEPGAGNVLAAPTDDSYIVGEIYENQNQNDFIVYQTTIPIPAEGT